MKRLIEKELFYVAPTQFARNDATSKSHKPPSRHATQLSGYDYFLFLRVPAIKNLKYIVSWPLDTYGVDTTASSGSVTQNGFLPLFQERHEGWPLNYQVPLKDIRHEHFTHGFISPGNILYSTRSIIQCDVYRRGTCKLFQYRVYSLRKSSCNRDIKMKREKCSVSKPCRFPCWGPPQQHQHGQRQHQIVATHVCTNWFG